MSNETLLMPRWVRLCRAMQGLSVLGVLTLGLVGVFNGGVEQVVDGHWEALRPNIKAVTEIDSGQRQLVMGLATVAFLSPIIILAGVWRVFGAFARGPALSPETVKTVAFLGWLIIVQAGVVLLIHTAIVLAMTYNNPEGSRVLAISLNFNHVLQILFGVLLVVLGHVLRHATTIAEENRQFI